MTTSWQSFTSGEIIAQNELRSYWRPPHISTNRSKLANAVKKERKQKQLHRVVTSDNTVRHPAMEDWGIVTVWWPPADLIHHRFFNPVRKYKQICLGLTNRRNPILLYHINARWHVSKTRNNLYKLGYTTFELPSYSPNLSLTDYYFFETWQEH